MMRYSASLVALLTLGCTMFGGGPRVGRMSPATDNPPPAVEHDADVSTQQGILNAYAKLEAEIAGLKAGRDAIGVNYSSVYPIGIAVSQTLMQLVLAILVWRIVRMVELVTRLSHERELQRIVATIGMSTTSEPTTATLPIQTKAAEER